MPVWQKLLILEDTELTESKKFDAPLLEGWRKTESFVLIPNRTSGARTLRRFSTSWMERLCWLLGQTRLSHHNWFERHTYKDDIRSKAVKGLGFGMLDAVAFKICIWMAWWCNPSNFSLSFSMIVCLALGVKITPVKHNMPVGASPRTAQGKYPMWSSANSSVLAGSSGIGNYASGCGFQVWRILCGAVPCFSSFVDFWAMPWCVQFFMFRKRDPIMMHSLIKYSVMELQKSIQHDIMEKLNEHTEAGAGVRPVAFCRSAVPLFPQQNLTNGCWKSLSFPTFLLITADPLSFYKRGKYGGHLKKQWVQGFNESYIIYYILCFMFFLNLYTCSTDN